jgi:hypothetical protein
MCLFQLLLSFKNSNFPERHYLFNFIILTCILFDVMIITLFVILIHVAY